LARPPRPNRTRKRNFISGSLARPAIRSNTRHDPGQRRHRGDGDDNEQDEINVIIRKYQSERQYGADVVDEAGGEDDLAELGAVVAGFDHNGVDDRHRGGGKRDAGNLRLRPGPAEPVPRKEQAAEVWGEETHEPDSDTRPEILLHHVRIDVGASKEGKDDRAERGDVIDPWRQGQPHRVSGNCADHDLEERGRDRDVKRPHGGHESERHPQGGLKPDVVHNRPFVRANAAQKNPLSGGSRKAPRRRAVRQGSSAHESGFGEPHPHQVGEAIIY
jgi:hypothetical protein